MTDSLEIKRYNVLIKQLLHAKPNSESEKKTAYMLASHCSSMARRINILENRVEYLKRRLKTPETQDIYQIPKTHNGLFMAMRKMVNMYGSK